MKIETFFLNMITSVAIQGVKGSFHDIVAQEYFGNKVSVFECLTFDEAIASIMDLKTDAVIMALENSIAGSILPNYALIDTNQLHIVGEIYLDIQHNLMALKGLTIMDIKEVYSHPMALLQCKKFFKQYPHIKLVEDKDTAEVAKRIHDNHLVGIAAIASEYAATLFDLEILAKSIQTVEHNETRFVIVKRTNHEVKESEINKASVKFALDHKRGSLATVLNVLSDCQMNLTKIQSLPVIDKPWEYAFFVDITFSKYEDYSKAKSIIEIMAKDFKVLGEYKKARE